VVNRSRRGETTIDFGDVAIRGVISAEGRASEAIVIASIEAEGSVQR